MWFLSVWDSYRLSNQSFLCLRRYILNPNTLLNALIPILVPFFSPSACSHWASRQITATTMKEYTWKISSVPRHSVICDLFSTFLASRSGETWNSMGLFLKIFFLAVLFRYSSDFLFYKSIYCNISENWKLKKPKGIHFRHKDKKA